MGAKASRYFDRKGERAAVEKFYASANMRRCGRRAVRHRQRQRRHCAGSGMPPAEGLNAADYRVPDFTTATTPDVLAEAELN